MSVTPQHLGGDRWRVRVYDASRKRQVSATFRAANKRAAKAASPAVEARLRQRVREAQRLRGTVAGAVADWKAQHDPVSSPSTIYRRDAILNAIVAGLGHHQLADLSPKHVDRWLNELRAENVSQSHDPTVVRHRSESTIAHYYRQLAAVLNQAARWGDVDRVATMRANRPKAIKTELTLPAAADLGRVVEAAPLPLRVIAKLAAHTGMRRGELCGLRWSDFNPADGTLHIQRAVVEVPGQPLATKTPKTRQTRRIDLGDAMVVELERHHRWLRAQAESCGVTLPDDCPMFAVVSPDGGVSLMSPGAVSTAWRKHCKQMGVTMRFHDLRHWHASAMLNDGQPLHAVSHRLGHSLPSTTQNIYGHRSDGADREIARRASELLP